MSERKYKKKLKTCEGCRRCNFVLVKKEKVFYCTIHKDHFISTCKKKVIRSDHE